MKDQIHTIIFAAIKKAYPNVEMPVFKIEPTDGKFGDYSANAAMILAKVVNEKPVDVAAKIIKAINETDNQIFESVEVAGPGFINFKMATSCFQKEVANIIEAGDKYGSSDLGKDLKVNVEFISGNPTGPLTIGNSRGGVIGDVLSNVLVKTNYNVTREYYFNDAGGQIDILGHSIIGDSEAQYRGDYIDDLRKRISGSDPRAVGKEAAQILIERIKKTAEEMGIKFDVWFAEGRDLREKGKVDEVLHWIDEKGLSYNSEGALWFRSTLFGDDKDRVLVRSNGEPTYFCVDCAYHWNKFVDRKFDRAINIWGADHHGDVPRVRGFVAALGYDDKFEIILHQFVRVVIDGKEVRMSKRTGTYVLVEDLLKEVGADVYRFFMLAYAPASHLNFDLALAKERSDKNPVYYVQYAHARINSILAKSADGHFEASAEKSLALLNEEAEISLIKQLIKLPELVEEIAGDYQVQKLTFYARELANAFHHFYEKCPVINSGSTNVTAARGREAARERAADSSRARGGGEGRPGEDDDR